MLWDTPRWPTPEICCQEIRQDPDGGLRCRGFHLMHVVGLPRPGPQAPPSWHPGSRFAPYERRAIRSFETTGLHPALSVYEPLSDQSFLLSSRGPVASIHLI